MYVGYINGTTFYVVYYLRVIVTRVDVDPIPPRLCTYSAYCLKLARLSMLPSLSKSMPSVDTGDAFMLESISIFAKLSESSKMYPSVLIPLFFNIEIIFCQSDGNLVPQGPLHGFIITYLIVPGHRSFLFENNIPLRVAWLKIWDYNYSYCLLESTSSRRVYYLC